MTQSVMLEDAFKKAEESYRLQTKEYRLGLVNNLEVLESMNAMEEAKRNFDRAVLKTKLDLLRLKAASEEFPGAGRTGP